MPVVRSPNGTSLIDVLDRVLDKGIVVDAWARVSRVGIDLTGVDARQVVAVTRNGFEHFDTPSFEAQKKGGNKARSARRLRRKQLG